jgi:hypothetical protein
VGTGFTRKRSLVAVPEVGCDEGLYLTDPGRKRRAKQGGTL